MEKPRPAKDPPDPSERPPIIHDRTSLAPLSSGTIRLDLALGKLGILRGAILEMEGPPGAGKTSLCQRIVAHAQRSGEVCAWFDLDHTLDPLYATRCGVDPDRLYLVEPQTGEQALEIALSLIQSGGLSLVVLDSLTAMVTRSEVDTALGEAIPRPGSEIVAGGLPGLARAARQTGAILILTKGVPNHPGVVYQGLRQKPARLASNLFASQRLQLESGRVIRSLGKVVGSRVQVKVIKDRIAATSRTFELDIMYNDGISDSVDLLDLGLEFQILEEQNSRLYFEGLCLGNDRAAATRFIQGHPQTGDRIRANIRQKTLSTLTDHS